MGCLLNHITEKVNEIRTTFGDNVQRRLDMVCEMYKEDVRVKMTRIYGNQQQIVNNVRDVVG